MMNSLKCKKIKTFCTKNLQPKGARTSYVQGTSEELITKYSEENGRLPVIAKLAFLESRIDHNQSIAPKLQITICRREGNEKQVKSADNVKLVLRQNESTTSNKHLAV